MPGSCPPTLAHQTHATPISLSLPGGIPLLPWHTKYSYMVQRVTCNLPLSASSMAASATILAVSSYPASPPLIVQMMRSPPSASHTKVLTNLALARTWGGGPLPGLGSFPCHYPLTVSCSSSVGGGLVEHACRFLRVHFARWWHMIMQFLGLFSPHTSSTRY